MVRLLGGVLCERTGDIERFEPFELGGTISMLPNATVSILAASRSRFSSTRFVFLRMCMSSESALHSVDEKRKVELRHDDSTFREEHRSSLLSTRLRLEAIDHGLSGPP